MMTFALIRLPMFFHEYITGKPDFHQIQGMQHQGGDNASTHSCNLKMEETLC
jgi:hypothetical protein